MKLLEELLPEELLTEAKRLLEENTQLKTDAEEKQKDCVEHLAKIEEQAGMINQLNSLIGSANSKSSISIAPKDELPSIPTEPIEHEGVQYQWQVASFKLPGDTKKYSAQDASADTELLKRILAINGQGILKKLA